MATAAPTRLDSARHGAARPMTWRYVFPGVWAADQAAANGTVLGGMGNGLETKIAYGVGRTFPDRSRTPETFLGLARTACGVGSECEWFESRPNENRQVSGAGLAVHRTCARRDSNLWGSEIRTSL